MTARPRVMLNSRRRAGKGVDALAVGEDRAARFHSYATNSLEEAHDAIAAHYYDMRLEVVGRATEFETRLGVVDLGALTVGDVRFGTAMRVSFGGAGGDHGAGPPGGGVAVHG